MYYYLSSFQKANDFYTHYGEAPIFLSKFNLKDHIETIAVIIILITTLPILSKLIFSDKKKPQHSKV